MSDLDPSTAILILRFPDGDVQHRTTRAELPIGARVRTRGTDWRVRTYDESGAAILEAVPAATGAAGGPVVIPDALGDKPLTVEVLAEV